MNFEYQLLILATCLVTARVLWVRYHYEYLITEGCEGLLYHEGRLVDTLRAGRHVRWGRNFRVDVIGVRKTLLQVAGQEVLTADTVGVRLSAVLTMQIVDAAKSVLVADSYLTHLYNTTQAAMRVAVGGITAEALLEQRAAISEQLRAAVQPVAESVGVQLHTVEVRDVMLPGDLRKAFSETLKAKQESQAALERARGESAALRHLANTARLMESHPGLTTLRFLQTLEAKGAGPTYLMNDLSALLPVLRGRGGVNAGNIDDMGEVQ
jgi:regulator of protease activity HflC (stomatin/prohibitin superfamily)